MEQKKRHNPIITEEDKKQFEAQQTSMKSGDLAVKAFDRNNDALPVKGKKLVGLEDAVNNAVNSKENIDMQKGNLALRDELCYLLKKCFGEDIYVMSMFERIYEPINKIYKEKSDGTDWPIAVKKKTKWFKPAVYEEQARIVLKKTADGSVLPIHKNNQFNPITMCAYTPEALKKAKIFAKAYTEFTGQEVELIRECIDEDELKKIRIKTTEEDKSKETHLEEKVKGKTFNRFADMGEEFFKDMDRVKGTFPVIKGLGKGIYTGALMPFFGYSSVKRMKATFDTTDINEGAAEFTTGLVVGLTGTILGWAYAGGKVVEEGNYTPLGIIAATQSVNIAGSYLKSLWNRSKK